MNLDASEARAAKNIARSFRQRVTRGAHIFLLPFYYRKFLLGSPLLVAHDQQGVGALGPFIPPPPPLISPYNFFLQFVSENVNDRDKQLVPVRSAAVGRRYRGRGEPSTSTAAAQAQTDRSARLLN